MTNECIYKREENETTKSKKENVPSQGNSNKKQKEEKEDQQCNLECEGERQKTNAIQVRC